MQRLIRRTMHLYWRFSRGMTLGVRGLVLDGDGKIFLIKHSYVPGWHLPGGGVEPGETALEALARELMEEGNLEIAAPEFFGLYFNKLASNRDHVALYVIRSFRQTSAPKPNAEIVDHGFFAHDHLPADTTAATRARIAEVLEARPKNECW